jgi:hypothetical protein
VRAKALADFISWAMRDGQGMVEALDYARLPETVIQVNEATLRTLKANGKPVFAAR